MMKRYSAVLFMFAIAACSDGPTTPPEASSVQIQADGAPTAEQMLEVGKSVQLTAVVEMNRASGEPTPVSWRSTVQSVASVDQNGIVTGVSAGVSLVIASADRVADTVRVVVSHPPVAEVICDPDDPRVQLSVGEVRQVRANELPLFCFPGGDGGAEFAMIPLFASSTGTLPVEILGGGVQAPAQLLTSVARAPASGAAAMLGASAQQQSREDWNFHMRMRQTERSMLATRPRRDSQLSLNVAGASSTPAVGATLRLNASTEGCTNAKWRGGRVEAVSSRAIIVADTLNPANGFTTSDYQAFAAEFDSRVWPVVTQNFGEPSDVDANDRVIVFFTSAVNELTEPGSGSYVGGFYHPRDLFPTTGTGSCATSNEAEILYQLVPDPARAAENDEPFLTRDEVRRRTVAVIAHELQHLVNASRRIFELNAPVETVWLNEGLSHIAEELVFYHEAGLGPEQNIDIVQLRSSQTILTAVNRHQVSNIGRFISFLESPDAFNFADGNDLVTRGASWAFLRYAADRAATPQGQRDLWFALVNSELTGINNVSQAFGIQAYDWFQDWTVSVLTDDTSLAMDDRFRQPSWDLRSVVQALTQSDYPLETRTLTSGQSLELTLRAGGSSYVRFAVPSGTTSGVRVTSNRISPPAPLRLSIVRTR
jgi:hypothetical protein